MVKNEKNQSCSKLPEMARKLVENDFFWLFRPPPQKNLLAVQKFLVKNEKNQSCSKLPEMTRKLVENNFGFLRPQPEKKGTKKWLSKITKKWKKSKLSKIAWNDEKIGRKQVLDCLAPPPKKNLEGVQKIVVENEKNQSCSKLPAMARKFVENDFWTF